MKSWVSKSVIIALPVFAIIGIPTNQVRQAATLKAAEPPQWVPYTATYTSTTTITGRPTRTIIRSRTQAADGTQITIDSENGQPFGGKYWKGSGELYGLDFGHQRAIYQHTYPRQRQGGYGQAIGSDTIANIACTVFSVKVQNGTGSVCVDMARDILVREEIHVNNPDGIKDDHVMVLTAIDFSKPAADEKLDIPQGFTRLDPAPATGADKPGIK